MRPVERTINTQVRPQIDHVQVGLVLYDRITNQARRHISHGGLPCHASVVANEEEAAAGGRIDRRRVYASRFFAICQDRIGKAAAIAAIARREIFRRRLTRARVVVRACRCFADFWMTTSSLS